MKIARAKSNGLYGYIDESGDWLIEPRYQDATDFSDPGIAAIRETSCTWCLVRPDGNKHAEVQRSIDEMRTPSGGMIPFRKGNRWGFLNTNGKVVIESRFLGRVASDVTSDLLRFVDGQAAVGYSIVDLESGESRDAIGVIEPSGNWLVEASACSIGYGEGSLVLDCRLYSDIGDPPWGFDFRPLGRVSGPELRVPFEIADKIRSSQNGLIPYGCVSGRVSSDLLYSGTESHGADDKWGLLNWRGEIVLEADFEDVKSLGEGRIATKKVAAWKLLRTDSQAIAELEIMDIRSFSSGLAPAKATNGMWGYIDPDASWRIEPRFTDCGPYVKLLL